MHYLHDTYFVKKQELKIEAAALRIKGHSLAEISTKLGVSKSTVRSWTSDVKLSDEVKLELKRKAFLALDLGRKKAQQAKTTKRLAFIEREKQRGLMDIGALSSRDLLVIGAALYWAEGFKNKYEYRLGFCNSDPKMIVSYLKFLTNSLGVNRDDLAARLSLNFNYEAETKKIETYWSKITGIPLSQFTKPFYQRVVWKKEYADRSYKGVLRIHVNNRSELLAYMKGLIEGISA